jgi:AraC-like DNA-binding protein
MPETILPPPNRLSSPGAAAAADGRHAEVLDELVRTVGHFAPTDGLHETALAPLQLMRASAPGLPLPAVYEPGLVLVLQGRKQARLGPALVAYDPLHFLLVSVAVLPMSQIVEASPERPYLCIRLRIDPQDIADLLLQQPGLRGVADAARQPRALAAARVPLELLDAVARLVRLLQAPEHAPVLAPLALREIHYRVLTGELGGLLADIAAGESQARRIAAAIALVRRRFDEPLRIEELADAAHMSPSTLHHHFKRVTSMSPLQYQKHLRLHHARQLMLGQGLDAAGAGHRVGYGSPSQFSREYRRLFGAPPGTEVRALRGGPAYAPPLQRPRSPALDGTSGHAPR